MGEITEEQLVGLAIVELGRLVEPEVNAFGFRQVPVRIMGGLIQPIHHQQVPRAIENTLAALNEGELNQEHFDALIFHRQAIGNKV